jgi:hypothetical protein
VADDRLGASTPRIRSSNGRGGLVGTLLGFPFVISDGEVSVSNAGDIATFGLLALFFGIATLLFTVLPFVRDAL